MNEGATLEKAGPDPAESSVWNRRFLVLMLGALALRAAYASVFPLDLAPDESYYWDWGRRLDYGYFSKPPMIAWLMALAGWVGQDSMFVLKTFPALLAILGLVFVFLLGRDLWNARAGFWAAVLMLATPANAALNTFFTIDAPLFLFWSASLWLAWRWWSAAADGRSGRWAAALAVSLGLGYLTKQIQLVFPVLLAAFAWSMWRGGRWGRRSGGVLLLAVVASLVFLAPPLLWNWRHDWITLRHTAGELQGSTFRLGRSLKFLGEFVGGQVGLGGGLTWILMIVAAVGVLARWRRADERERFLAIFFLPGLAVFVALACFQRVEQNWPLVFYVSATLLLAGTTLKSVGKGDAGRVPRKLKIAAALGAALAVVLMAVPFVVPASPWAGRRSDPTARIRGWRELARQVEAIRKELPDPGRTILLAPAGRYVASALAYYLPDKPRTYGWEDPAHPKSQYGIWGRPLDKVGWDALVIEEDPSADRIRDLSGRFDHWQPRGMIVVRLGAEGARDRRYQVFLGRGLRGVL